MPVSDTVEWPLGKASINADPGAMASPLIWHAPPTERSPASLPRAAS